jgi:phage tail-like protein
MVTEEKQVTLIKDQNAAAEVESRLLEYLPTVFRDDPMMGKFLLIFESILNPVENTVDNLALYFDPLLTPEQLLPWLASWVDLTMDPGWPLERRRELIKSAAELYRWRGTRRGLAEYLRIYTGVQPEILEYIPGMILDEKSRLGVNTVLGSSGTGHHFTVILDLNKSQKIDTRIVRKIIDSQKPAHTVYTLEIR